MYHLERTGQDGMFPTLILMSAHNVTAQVRLLRIARLAPRRFFQAVFKNLDARCRACLQVPAIVSSSHLLIHHQ